MSAATVTSSTLKRARSATRDSPSAHKKGKRQTSREKTGTFELKPNEVALGFRETTKRTVAVPAYICEHPSQDELNNLCLVTNVPRIHAPRTALREFAQGRSLLAIDVTMTQALRQRKVRVFVSELNLRLQTTACQILLFPCQVQEVLKRTWEMLPEATASVASNAPIEVHFALPSSVASEMEHGNKIRVTPAYVNQIRKTDTLTLVRHSSEPLWSLNMYRQGDLVRLAEDTSLNIWRIERVFPPIGPQDKPRVNLVLHHPIDGTIELCWQTCSSIGSLPIHVAAPELKMLQPVTVYLDAEEAWHEGFISSLEDPERIKIALREDNKQVVVPRERVVPKWENVPRVGVKHLGNQLSPFRATRYALGKGVIFYKVVDERAHATIVPHYSLVVWTPPPPEFSSGLTREWQVVPEELMLGGSHPKHAFQAGDLVRFPNNEQACLLSTKTASSSSWNMLASNWRQEASTCSATELKSASLVAKGDAVRKGMGPGSAAIWFRPEDCTLVPVQLIGEKNEKHEQRVKLTHTNREQTANWFMLWPDLSRWQRVRYTSDMLNEYRVLNTLSSGSSSTKELDPHKDWSYTIQKRTVAGKEEESPFSVSPFHVLPIEQHVKSEVVDKKEEAKDVSKSALCIACQDKPLGMVLMPCRHLNLCSECAQTISKSTNRCPMCRHVIQTMFEIFM